MVITGSWRENFKLAQFSRTIESGTGQLALKLITSIAATDGLGQLDIHLITGIAASGGPDSWKLNLI